MNLQSILTPIAFLFLALLISWFVIAAKGKWYLKFAATLISVAISGMLYCSMGTYFGYPRVATADNIPSRSKFCWAQIVEPSQNDKGAIYMWLKIDDIKSSNPFDYVSKGEPIIFKFPYSRKMHEIVDQLLLKIIDQKGGEEEIMLMSYDLPKPGSDYKGGYNDAISSRGGTFEVYDLPQPKLPEKNQAK